MESKRDGGIPLSLEVRLFGAFRQFGAQPVQLSLPAGCTVREVKSALGDTLAETGAGNPDKEKLASLLDSSVLATSRRVLADADVLHENQSLAVLPPVCGG